MAFNRVEIPEALRLAIEALGRYRLRTSLSLLGIVLGVSAVIAMMSVSQGAARQALAQVEVLGLDNLVARNRAIGSSSRAGRGLAAGDALRLATLVPLTRTVSPLLERNVSVDRADRSTETRVLGVESEYQVILRLSLERGRFLSVIDESAAAPVFVLGASLARRLLVFRDPLGEAVAIDRRYFRVVGVLRSTGLDAQSPGTLGWRDISEVAIVPLSALSGRSADVVRHQPLDEIWLQVLDGTRIEELARIFEHTLTGLTGGKAGFDIIVPRELLAQRYRAQRTCSTVVGSIAAISLIVGAIGIMNMMLTSVVERTAEIGIRRTIGASRCDVAVQFLAESLMVTLAG